LLRNPIIERTENLHPLLRPDSKNLGLEQVWRPGGTTRKASLAVPIQKYFSIHYVTACNFLRKVDVKKKLRINYHGSYVMLWKLIKIELFEVDGYVNDPEKQIATLPVIKIELTAKPKTERDRA